MKNKTVTTILTAAAITATTLGGTSLTFAEEIPVEEATEAVLTEETSETEQVDIEAAAQADMDDAEVTEATAGTEAVEQGTGRTFLDIISDERTRIYSSNDSDLSIYVASNGGSDGIKAGAVTSFTTSGNIWYKWTVYTGYNTDNIVYETDWVLNNEWFQYTPDKPGDYSIDVSVVREDEDIYEDKYGYCVSPHANSTSVTYNPNYNGKSSASFVGVDIYVASQGSTGITAGMVTQITTPGDLEYHWQVYDCKTDECVFETDWVVNNEWLQYTPDKPGDYILIGEVRAAGDSGVASYVLSDSTRVSYHPNIKGKCQMPYTGEGGGYLIGVESYDNPNQEYEYEMLILDCTLLAEGKDAWTYSTGKCKVPETSFWTVWQPQYGYYWTLFRVYDKAGNLIDEDCYGFENTGRPTVIKPLDKYQQHYVDEYNVALSPEYREYCKTEMKAYNYAVSTGVRSDKADTFAGNVARDRNNLINKPGYEWLQGNTWLEGYETYFK